MAPFRPEWRHSGLASFPCECYCSGCSRFQVPRYTTFATRFHPCATAFLAPCTPAPLPRSKTERRKGRASWRGAGWNNTPRYKPQPTLPTPSSPLPSTKTPFSTHSQQHPTPPIRTGHTHKADLLLAATPWLVPSRPLVLQCVGERVVVSCSKQGVTVTHGTNSLPPYLSRLPPLLI